MRCANCGYDITDPNAVACPNCGQPLPVSLPPQDSAPPPETPPTPLVSTPQSAPIPTPPSTPLSTASPQQTPRLSALLAPLPPVRKRGIQPLIPIIVGVVVVAVIFGLLIVFTGQENGFNGEPTPPSSTLSPTNTAEPGIAYQNTFAKSASGWASDQHCFLRADGYHVTEAGCFAPIDSLQAVDVKVTVEQISGDPQRAYGIVVRAASPNYRYDIVIYSTGEWSADRCDGITDQTSAACYPKVPITPNAAIHAGLNTKNTLEVHAEGTHFDVSINGVSVGSFDDTIYAEGKIGFVTGADIEAVYTNLVVTRLN